MPHFDFATLFSAENAAALVTLTLLEIVLGIDNIVFLSIVTGRLPEAQRPRARLVGLSVAMGARVLLLLTLSWLMGLDASVIRLLPRADPGTYLLDLSIKDMILIAGGLFLVGKAAVEIHHKIEGGESAAGQHPDPARHLGEKARRAPTAEGPSFASVIAQVLAIDMVFSIDSVVTAVGMSKHLGVMILAILIAVGVMMIASGWVSAFIEKHPTMKMLALAFLVLIGVMLIAEGLGEHIPRGYIYFGMAFAFAVEILNSAAARRHQHAAERRGP